MIIKNKNKLKLKTKSKILVLGFMLVMIIGLFSPIFNAKAFSCTGTDTSSGTPVRIPIGCNPCTPPQIEVTSSGQCIDPPIGVCIGYIPASIPAPTTPRACELQDGFWRTTGCTPPKILKDGACINPPPSTELGRCTYLDGRAPLLNVLSTACIGGVWVSNSGATQTTTIDNTYHFLAPLPCTGTPESGCVDGKLMTFDPTSDTANNNKLGEYLNLMIKIFIGICAVLAVIMIVMGGIEYMMTELVSGKEAGKERIRNALLGLLLALGAYTLLNTINPDILKTDLSSLKDAKVEVTLETLPNGSYSSTGGAGGSCVVPTDPNNACSPTKLASTCFANRANEASKVCNVESGGGRTDVPSGSDLLNNGTGPSYSIGLWQINLTANDVDNLGCRSAFSGVCGPGTATPSNSGPFVGGPKVGNCSVTIKNQALYDKCVAAAKDPVKNTTAACKLYGDSGSSFKPWRYTANKCSVPLR